MTMRLLAIASTFSVIAVAHAGCASSPPSGGGGGGGCCLVPSCSVPVNLQMCGSETPPAPAAPSAPAPATASKTEVPARASDEALRRRASFELDCDAAKVEIVVLDATTRGARGCDKRATYVEKCEAGRCEWHPSPTAPPAPTAPPS